MRKVTKYKSYNEHYFDTEQECIDFENRSRAENTVFSVLHKSTDIPSSFMSKAAEVIAESKEVAQALYYLIEK
jgi:hypothetical protein